MFSKDFLEAFWQAVLYNTIENAHPKLFMSIRKDLGNKCLKKLENWRWQNKLNNPSMHFTKFRQLTLIDKGYPLH